MRTSVTRRLSLTAALTLLTTFGCIVANDEGNGFQGADSLGGSSGNGSSAMGGTTGGSGAGTAGSAQGGSAQGGSAQAGAAAGEAGDAGEDGRGGAEQLPLPDAGSDECMESEIMQGMTAAHNAVRDTVTPPNNEPLPPLSWSCELAEVAQAYAEHLANDMDCALVHSGGDYGENIYWSYGFQPSAQDVVDGWASEEPCYSYDKFPDQCSDVPDVCDQCGHYTQMVWRNTELVGCGMALCGPQQEQIWVCNYDPPGNWLTQYPY